MTNALLNSLREKVARARWAGQKQYEIAKGMGVSAAFLSAVLHGNKPMSAVVLEYIGFEKQVTVEYLKVNGNGKARPAGTNGSAQKGRGNRPQGSRARASRSKNG